MTVQFKVPSMVCDGCAETVTKAIQTVDPGAKVNIVLETKEVSVESNASLDAIKEAIAAKDHTVE
ncbi:MAG: heavy-metal-associated domain-containing protein [Hormoscilla sp.]